MLTFQITIFTFTTGSPITPTDIKKRKSQAALTLRTITFGSDHMFKVIRDAYWKHISNIFSSETESPDPSSPRKNEKGKTFGHL